LKIDLDHDVVAEIYDSWHNFFSITRELIKDIPVNKVKNPSTRQIITLSIGVLNEGLRPHLTSWQARFRRWYDKQLASAADDADPQSIQAQYPKFEELKIDLLLVNQRLIKYREKMRELVLGGEEFDIITPSTDNEPTL
jgi:phage terminase Nu1 subunit (DNA packaging protein)